MTFVPDNRNSSTLASDSRTAVASLTQDSRSGYGISWGANFNTWAAETRTWASIASSLTLDTRN